MRSRQYLDGYLKRGFDLTASVLILLVLAPVYLILSLAVLVSSGPPILFVQMRAGKHGRPFRLLKFRTMRLGSHRGLSITSSRDGRVTRLGRFLRASKLDELPQIINVFGGQMSLVGPRPEVCHYVLNYSAEQKRVLEARPGLTDPATLFFVDEESLLERVAEDRRETYYVTEILPKKLRLNLDYIDRAGFWYDAGLIARTLRAILFR